MMDIIFEGHHVRVQQDDKGEAWFCAKDVCEAVGLRTESVRRLDDDARGLRKTQTPCGTQEMTFISEPGLYRLVTRSSKPAAKRFSSWVFDEVLPEIRRTGRYVGKPDNHNNDTGAVLAAVEGMREEFTAQLATMGSELARIKSDWPLQGFHGHRGAGRR